jgi:DNA-binding NarL/FixJ family response regulator
MAIRVVLADDHPLILEGLDQLFRLEADFDIVARCVNGVEAVEAVRRYQPDVLVLDIRMPGGGGIEALRSLQREKLPTRAVIFTAGLDEGEVVEAMRLGVRGVVLKSMPSQMLLRCLRKVHAGEQWLERRSAGRALERLLQREAGAKEAAAVLTARETEIVRMVATGLRNREIAASLIITEGTVKAHMHHIYQKLEMDSRVDLVRWAEEKGLI